MLGTRPKLENAAPSGCDNGAPDGARGPWYSPHTGSLFHKWAQLNDKRNDLFTLQIYPSGMKLQAVSTYSIQTKIERKRGVIRGFSHEAARRLRETFFTMHIPGFDFWAYTLTTHRIHTPPEWRAVMKRFRVALKGRGWAGVWRAELQKRKAPHAHVALWVPPGCSFHAVRDLWLNCTREQDDPGAYEHAVMGKKVPQDETGWAVYMGLHDGKHKTEQLGWLGKQWGVWNRAAFVKREPVLVVLDHRDKFLLVRVLEKLHRGERYRIQLEKEEIEQALAREFTFIICCARRRPKIQRIHRGNLLRCIKGETVGRIVRAIQSGQLGRGAGAKGAPETELQRG